MAGDSESAISGANVSRLLKAFSERDTSASSDLRGVSPFLAHNRGTLAFPSHWRFFNGTVVSQLFGTKAG